MFENDRQEDLILSQFKPILKKINSSCQEYHLRIIFGVGLVFSNIISRSISKKLVVIAGSAVSLTLIGFTGLAGWKAAERTDREIMALASEKATSTAGQVTAQITEAMSAGISMAAALSGFAEGGTARREDAVAATKAVLEGYPNLFGAWISDTIDGRLGKVLGGTASNNDKGLFTPYWTKSGSGKLEWPAS